MKYRVVLTSRAERQLYQAALWWAENRDAGQAARWIEGFEAVLGSLSENPERHGVAREDSLFPFPVRQLLYGLGKRPSHRAVFEVRGDEVIVHAIRHVSQRDLTPDDLS
jgi:plasmid stabilization system protein ParE